MLKCEQRKRFFVSIESKLNDKPYTVITLFFVLEIFSDGSRYPKICYTNINPVRKIFSIEILLIGRWLMVIPTIDQGNSVPDIRVVGSLESGGSVP